MSRGDAYTDEASHDFSPQNLSKPRSAASQVLSPPMSRRVVSERAQCSHRYLDFRRSQLVRFFLGTDRSTIMEKFYWLIVASHRVWFRHRVFSIARSTSQWRLMMLLHTFCRYWGPVLNSGTISESYFLNYTGSNEEKGWFTTLD